jgi:hypothetical protein
MDNWWTKLLELFFFSQRFTGEAVSKLSLMIIDVNKEKETVEKIYSLKPGFVAAT